MSSPASVTPRSPGLMSLFCALLCEGAALLPIVAPEVIWVTIGQAIWLHLVAALLSGVGIASLFRERLGSPHWGAPAVLFGLITFVIPGAGIGVAILMALILRTHQKRATEEESPFVEVETAEPPVGTIHDAGPLPQPLVGMMDRMDPDKLQRVVLGMEEMPPGKTRPLLKKLQGHPDVRVQLYANGLLNDQLDVIERKMGALKQRVERDNSDIHSQLALVEMYRYQLDNDLIALDEVQQVALQAFQETKALLEKMPDHPVGLECQAEFLLHLQQYQEAADAVEKLFHRGGYEHEAIAMHHRVRYEFATAQEITLPVLRPTDSKQLKSQSPSS